MLYFWSGRSKRRQFVVASSSNEDELPHPVPSVFPCASVEVGAGDRHLYAQKTSSHVAFTCGLEWVHMRASIVRAMACWTRLLRRRLASREAGGAAWRVDKRHIGHGQGWG